MSEEQRQLWKTEKKTHGLVTCLGMTFQNDHARRTCFNDKLSKKLQDSEFRKIEGFPIGSDEDIPNLSDPPYYTACPNPWIVNFIIAEHLTRQRVFEHIGDNLYRAESVIRERFERRTEQVTEQVRRLILAVGDEPKAAVELMELLELRHRPSFQQTYLRPASELGVIEMTLPDKPRSQNQKYLITDLGRKVREKLRSADDER